MAKILVLELARLGDIYQTWPALRALHRQRPNDEIHILTRPRFSSALEGIGIPYTSKILHVSHLLEPVIDTRSDIKEAYDRMNTFVDELRAENYDEIINFSFSPASSYLAHAVSQPWTKVIGYTRHDDGFLAIPDDMSAYFYAQVGISRSNRFHLCDVFGTMVSSDLEAADWRSPEFVKVSEKKRQVLIHIGASEAKKSLSAAKWSAIIKQIALMDADLDIILIGTKEDLPKAGEIANSVTTNRLQSMVGQTDLKQLFQLIADSMIVIGADSAPMHMASLTGTSCLNLSLASVSFWETGPRSKGSVIYRANDETEIVSDKVAQILLRMVRGEKQEIGLIKVVSGTPCYQAFTSEQLDFEWNLIQAIYMGVDFPGATAPEFHEGIFKLQEINDLMLSQLDFVKSGGDLNKVASILDRGDEIISTIGKLVPSILPLIRWYQTEKIRIPPLEQQVLINVTYDIQKKFGDVIQLYVDSYHIALEKDKKDERSVI